ncbi:hypothetical protein, partial [Burkholderia pseudomallei]|uniref:hypothetical protein n=1 Tax=Burkholderia pseudomallei TaxID=28450 RepID=UPI001C4B96CA
SNVNSCHAGTLQVFSLVPAARAFSVSPARPAAPADFYSAIRSHVGHCVFAMIASTASEMNMLVSKILSNLLIISRLLIRVVAE